MKISYLHECKWNNKNLMKHILTCKQNLLIIISCCTVASTRNAFALAYRRTTPGFEFMRMPFMIDITFEAQSCWSNESK